MNELPQITLKKCSCGGNGVAYRIVCKSCDKAFYSDKLTEALDLWGANDTAYKDHA